MIWRWIIWKKKKKFGSASPRQIFYFFSKLSTSRSQFGPNFKFRSRQLLLSTRKIEEKSWKRCDGENYFNFYHNINVITSHIYHHLYHLHLGKRNEKRKQVKQEEKKQKQQANRIGFGFENISCLISIWESELWLKTQNVMYGWVEQIVNALLERGQF